MRRSQEPRRKMKMAVPVPPIAKVSLGASAILLFDQNNNKERIWIL
jgi:hypothetical protein